MKLDISPTGMHETGRKATRQGDDIDTDVRMLLDVALAHVRDDAAPAAPPVR